MPSAKAIAPDVDVQKIERAARIDAAQWVDALHRVPSKDEYGGSLNGLLPLNEPARLETIRVYLLVFRKETKRILTSVEASLAREIRACDELWRGDSAMLRLSKRAAWLDSSAYARHASYPLEWLITTARISSPTLDGLLAMPPRAFAATALAIAASLDSVRVCADAWIAAAKAPQKPARTSRK